MTAPQTRTEAAELLRQAIKRSSLSNSAYAREVLTRDPRSVRRWLAGTAVMPRAIRDFLSAPVFPER